MRFLKVAGEYVMDEPVGGVLSHAALFYRSRPQYASRIAGFVRAGLDRGEPALLALPDSHAATIVASLDSAPGEVVFADMTTLGRNPARIIPEVRSFTEKHPGQRVRFVGEPIWPGRSPAETREAARHEALLNLAFARAEATILCPYDASGLAGSVLADARCTHQEPTASGATAATWRDNLPPECDQPLCPPPAEAEALAYEMDLAPVRRLVERCAWRAGLGEERTVDLVLAANEIAANTISHTSGGGVIHVWHTGEEILCQVHDSGWITDPMAGRIRHGPEDRGHGLWLVNQVCDLVELRSGEDGTTVRMRMRLGG
jgi:anti-sigma regulatory factor (Ser/Thr protein kinase)